MRSGDSCFADQTLYARMLSHFVAGKRRPAELDMVAAIVRGVRKYSTCRLLLSCQGRPWSPLLLTDVTVTYDATPRESRVGLLAKHATTDARTRSHVLGADGIVTLPAVLVIAADAFACEVLFTHIRYTVSDGQGDGDRMAPLFDVGLSCSPRPLVELFRC